MRVTVLNPSWMRGYHRYVQALFLASCYVEAAIVCRRALMIDKNDNQKYAKKFARLMSKG